MKNVKLQAAREASGKTQAQVAQETGVAVRLYQSYEYGACEPTVRTAIRIADALHVKDLRQIFIAQRELPVNRLSRLQRQNRAE